jgi:hypothetical protein
MSETRTIATNGIAVATHRLRALHEENVNALAQSMADQGQLQPGIFRGSIIRSAEALSASGAPID